MCSVHSGNGAQPEYTVLFAGFVARMAEGRGRLQKRAVFGELVGGMASELHQGGQEKESESGGVRIERDPQAFGVNVDGDGMNACRGSCLL